MSNHPFHDGHFPLVKSVECGDAVDGAFCLFRRGLGSAAILYSRTIANAASFAPFGLPNAAIARGSIFTVFGENLGPAVSPSLAFPLSTTLGGVSLSVTQGGVTTSTYPIYVSAAEINAILPSTVRAGLASLRLTYQGVKSNAITRVVANASPAYLLSY